MSESAIELVLKWLTPEGDQPPTAVVEARLELARLRDCELMLRAHMADEAFRPQFIRTRARGPKDAWSLRFREDTGGGTWAWSSKTVLADDGTGLPLLDAAARERIGKELEGK